MAKQRTMAIQLIRIGCLLWVALSGAISAKEIAFTRQGLKLNFVWQYQQRPIQAFTLVLPNETALPPWQTWRNQQAEAYVYQQLMQTAKEQFPDAVFKLRRNSGSFTVDYTTADQSQLNNISQWLYEQQKTLFKSYLDQHYYKQHGGESSQLIRPDHIRIAQDSSEELKEIAQTLQQIILATATEEEKKEVNEDEKQLVLPGLLNFVQSIPYDPLSSDDGRRGLSFLMPEQVLAQNRGDCDSKSALFIALVIALYPDLEQAMIYVPDHALVGVDLPQTKADQKTLQIRGKPFLLFEVTGPAEIPPGFTGDKSRLYVSSQNYSYDLYQPSDTNSSPN